MLRLLGLPLGDYPIAMVVSALSAADAQIDQLTETGGFAAGFARTPIRVRINPAVIDPMGYPVGYELVPGHAAGDLLDSDD
jgi:hypothetical protein